MNNDQWSGFVILYFKRVPLKKCGQKGMDTQGLNTRYQVKKKLR